MNKLTANQQFCHSDLVTDFFTVILSQSEGLGKMALGIAKYAHDRSSQLISVIWFAVSCRGSDEEGAKVKLFNDDNVTSIRSHGQLHQYLQPGKYIACFYHRAWYIGVVPYLLADSRNFFLIFFFLNVGATNPLDISANRHQVGTKLKVFGYCKYRIFRLISRYRHELYWNCAIATVVLSNTGACACACTYQCKTVS